MIRNLSDTGNALIKDQFGRSFKTLRVSLTNKCNLACNYCVPEKAKSALSAFSALSCDEYLKVVERLYRLTGIHTVRLTGGEPLLYKQIIPLVKGLKQIGIENIKLTTNGLLLAGLAGELKEAGLDSVNVSLDALDEEIFFKVSRRRNVDKVLEGIDQSIGTGINVKLNSVVMKGVNQGQILPLLDYAGQKGITIRFLELMNMGHLSGEHSGYFFPEEEILEEIGKKYKFYLSDREASATARYWTMSNLQQFGIISNISHPFCSDCNRLRLDSFGRIFGCLSSNNGIRVMDCLDNGTELAERLMAALRQKQLSFTGSALSMKSIGG